MGLVFFRKDNTLPFLEKKCGKYNVVLSGNSGKPIKDLTEENKPYN